MNYGKKKASQKQKRITSRSRMQKKRIGFRLFKAFVLCIVLLGMVGVIGCGVFIKKIIDDSPEITADDIKPSGYTTFIYADDGTTETERLVSSGSNRIYKKIDSIPLNLQHAFVAIEDERFYQHNGVDFQGVIRAAVVGVTSGNFSEGASTITQQLVKNNVFPDFVNEDTFYEKLKRKIQEQYLAIEIEKEMDKDTILENYLNTINLGQNCLGVQSASKRYFGKDVSDLTLSECAVIAGITQNPTGYNPITNPDANKERQHKVLQNMLDQGYITQEDYDTAIADDVYTRIQAVNGALDQDEEPTTYFVDALIEQVTKDLQEQLGYSESQAYNLLYKGGLSIYSTQNLAMQQIADEEINDASNYPNGTDLILSYALTVTRADGTVENYGSGDIENFSANTYGDTTGLHYSSEEEARARIEAWKATIAKEGDTYDESINLSPQPQASFTLMDQTNGQIKAMVGGRGTKTSSMGLNRAYTGMTRQPGSCFKIPSTYAPALDAKGKTLATTIVDEPMKRDDGEDLVNADGTHLGSITIRKAITVSNNVVAVKLSDEITQELGMEYCEKFGISTLVKEEEIDGKIYSDLTQTMALGGLTHGVYNYEMAACYATIANGGVYNKPTLYSKILDHDGNVLLEGSGETRQVIKESTAALLTSAMTDVVTQGTGTNTAIANQPVSGKTGTTSDNKDLWFCGFTPYYTAAIWCGYDDNTEMNFTHTFKDIIWSKIMTRVHANLETKEFTMPSSVEQLIICTSSGKLATSGCPAVTDYFDKDTAPKDYCTEHSYSYSYDYNYNYNYNSTTDSANSTGTTNSTTGTTGTTGTTTDGTGGTTTPDTNSSGTDTSGTDTTGTDTSGGGTGDGGDGGDAAAQ